MNTSATASTVRELTPMELAEIVRALRENKMWSQEQLADIANLNPRTIQRVERGEPSSTDTRRALADAFGFQDIDAWNKPYPIPSPEELAAAKEQFEKEHVTLKAEVSTNGNKLAKRAEAIDSAVFWESFELPRKVLETYATLKDYLQEYADSSDLYSEVDKLTAYDFLDELLKSLAENGISICTGMRDGRFRNQNGENSFELHILYICTFKKGEEPEHFVVPRKLNFG